MMERKGERYDWQGADAPCQAPLSPARREKFASGRLVELAPGCPGTRQWGVPPPEPENRRNSEIWVCLPPVGGVKSGVVCRRLGGAIAWRFAVGRRSEIWGGLPPVGGVKSGVFAAGRRSEIWVGLPPVGGATAWRFAAV
ncbi:Uncharacterized protein TCM_025908 [Theobroma cacao]|uniref:Uncharacterized protein n=1 Tax=Theobroma cacao TaxID=3641 RepID=A0A061F7U1_THECC|nr:Uncharacterized protein TCM_025908 [Theobroma cacao]